jgi:hypothetical protein
MITGTVQSGSSGDGIESTFPGCGDVGYKFNEKKPKRLPRSGSTKHFSCASCSSRQVRGWLLRRSHWRVVSFDDNWYQSGVDSRERWRNGVKDSITDVDSESVRVTEPGVAGLQRADTWTFLVKEGVSSWSTWWRGQRR